LAESFNNDGRTLPRRTFNDAPSIAAITADDIPQIDFSALDIGGAGYSSKVGANASASGTGTVNSRTCKKFCVCGAGF